MVGAVEYRWRAKGDDGYISIGIWPVNKIGPYIRGNLCYHETWIDVGDGRMSSAGNQIVVTNRIIRRIIEHAIADRGYDPQQRGKELNLQVLDDAVKWDDAVRGSWCINQITKFDLLISPIGHCRHEPIAWLRLNVL